MAHKSRLRPMKIFVKQIPNRIRKTKFYTGLLDFKFRLSSFFVDRRLSSIIFLISIFLTIILVLALSQIYKQDKPLTSLNIVSLDDDNQVKIQKIEADVYYQGKGKDTLRVLAYLQGKFDGNENVIITFSKNIRINSEYHSTTSKLVNTYLGNYVYKILDPENAIVSEEYTGDIFGMNSQDLNMNFDLYLGYSPEVALNTPINIQLYQLTDLTISQSEPKPDKSSSYYFEYNFSPMTNPYPGYISINAVDRKGLNQTQFNIFILGTIIGILVSIASTIFIDFLKILENKSKVSEDI